MPSRRAAPTRASAASGPGQVTSSADERPGSVSEPWARNAPRHAASASQVAPETTCGGQPAHRTATPVEQAGLAGQGLAVADDPDDVAARPPQTARSEHDDVAGVSEDLGDVAAQPPRRLGGVELRLDHDPPAHDVQPSREPQGRRHLGLPAARLGHRKAAQLVLHQRRQSHAGHPATGGKAPDRARRRRRGVGRARPAVRVAGDARHGARSRRPSGARCGALSPRRRRGTPASRSGSCTAPPSRTRTSRSTRRAPIAAAMSASFCASSTELGSASTASTRSSGACAASTSR